MQEFIQQVLRDTGISKGDIDEIVLVGGSTEIFQLLITMMQS
jgi:molecular chaperone DnaK (HSP70)